MPYKNPEDRNARRRLRRMNPEYRSRENMRDVKRNRVRRLENQGKQSYHSRYRADRIARDPQYALKLRARRRVQYLLRGFKKKATAKYLGVKDWNHLWKHLKDTIRDEHKEIPLSEMHVDHICPLSSFDLADQEQADAAFHYTNLRLIPAEENLKKKHRVISVYQAVLLGYCPGAWPGNVFF